MICACGCGGETPIATKTDRRRDIVKGQSLRFLPGHNSTSTKTPQQASNVGLQITITPERIHPVGPQDIMRVRTWPNERAAQVFHERLVYLEETDKRSWAERGLILVEIEERELFRYVLDRDGNPYQTINQYLTNALPYSRSSCFDAKESMKALKGVPVEELLDVPRVNLKQLAKSSPAVRRDPEILKAAREKDEKAFVAEVNRKYPEQHIERKERLILKLDSSALEAVQEALEAAVMVLGLETREQAVEAICAAWMDSLAEDERYAGLRNRDVWVALQASGRMG